ncbi:MAG: MBL fold metallo-hydrolase [Gemmatimonadetes bacterium]|nr:MBL fold metallo-hydrolase [Gemmatimonadota bacterium]MBI3569249.1 MBL fold metallo-hydrolase [Gemmatimonadota bacterium]
MPRSERHGDVLRFTFETRTSRSMGFDVSTYLVRGTLVDTGFHDARRQLFAVLRTHRVDGVIVTHHHEDHAGNVDVVARRGYPVWIAPETLAHVRQPAPIGWYRRWCWGAQPAYLGTPRPYPLPDLEVIHAPGHAHDHHVVWDASTGTVFGADLYLGVKVKVSHPGEREDVRAQVASIRAVAALGPQRLFCAHRGLVPNPVAQLTAKADWMEETIAAIDARIDEGLDDGAIVRRVFGGEDRWMAFITRGDYARRNFVASVRRTHGATIWHPRAG